MTMRNSHIDRWITLADAPEVAKHFYSTPSLLKRAHGSPEFMRQIKQDNRKCWIASVFYGKAAPSDRDPAFPKIGIYELLKEHRRVFDMQGMELQPEQFDGILGKSVKTPRETSCASEITAQVQRFFKTKTFGNNMTVTTHQFFDDLRDDMLPLFQEPTFANILFCLDWPSIQLGAEILIPNPSENLILENFEVAGMEKELGV